MKKYTVTFQRGNETFVARAAFSQNFEESEVSWENLPADLKQDNYNTAWGTLFERDMKQYASYYGAKVTIETEGEWNVLEL